MFEEASCMFTTTFEDERATYEQVMELPAVQELFVLEKVCERLDNFR